MNSEVNLTNSNVNLDVNSKVNSTLLKFPLIIKISTSWKQLGIAVVANMDELNKAIKDLKIEPSKSIISEYISNPLLIHGLKFHLRGYYLLYKGHCIDIADNNSNMRLPAKTGVKTGNSMCFSHTDYKILTASKPYKKGNYTDTDIHLTGGHTHHKRYFWYKDFLSTYDKPFLEKCQTELEACNKMICKLLSSVDIKPYPESKAGFEIYCADLLITDDARVYLLEINNRCGMGAAGQNEGKKEYLDTFSKKFFEWVLNHIL